MKEFYRGILRRLVPPRTLRRINQLSHIDDRWNDLQAARASLAEIILKDRYGALFAPGRADPAEFRVFSQNGEDGILLSLLDQMDAPHKTFVEIGIENANECNTAILAFVLGWDGLMIEADPQGVDAARRLAARVLTGKQNRVRIEHAFATRENVNFLIRGAGLAGESGVLSIDVDGMDYWLWKAIDSVRPRVAVIEYNASLGPSRAITVPYQAEFRCREAHPSGFYHGASLRALEILGRQLGYTMVTTDSAGVNAFFVRNDICPPALQDRAAEELFRPHLLRSKSVTPEDQWAAVQHMPFVTVD